MAKRPHIFIIGAGLIGLATARACVDRGTQVTILERQTQTGCGAGFANSGMIHPSQSWPWVTGNLSETAQLEAAQAIAALADQSVPLLQARMKQLGLPDMARAIGCFKIFKTHSQREIAKIQYSRINVKVENADILGRPALHFSDDFSGSAYEWSQAETQALLKDGVDIQTGIDVSLVVKKGGVQARVNDHPIKADHIVLCAGHKTNALLSPLGRRLPIKPIQGYALDFDITGLDLSSLPHAPIMDAASHSALTLFENILRLSGTLGEQSAHPLWQRWCEVIPDLMPRLGTPRRVWSGYRPVSALGRPIISQSPLKGLWVNSGHGHMGWTLSAVSGEHMARLIIEGEDSATFCWPAH